MATEKPFRPMLAAAPDADAGETFDKLVYPQYGTPKIDGIRCLCRGGMPLSRSLKPIPNRFIQSVLSDPKFEGLDGELLVGNNFQQATSGIMTEEGEPDFYYYVFDVWDMPNAPYLERVNSMLMRHDAAKCARLVPLAPVRLDTHEELVAYSEKYVAANFEGVMVRTPDSPYKYGRATFKSGWLTKVKLFVDEEATIIGYTEQKHNANEATVSALGYTERSTHQANMVGKGVLGALVVHNEKWGEFNVGTGFDDAQRREIFANQAKYLGKLIKYRYQPHGVKDKPRIPSFKGFRHLDDL
jgi:DNA ligase-1